MGKIIIVAGVSGSGKTTIGKLLSRETGIPFYDADDFHPESNIKKMASGTPLNDEDRRPWLEILNKNLIDWQDKTGAILACSALKENYRKQLERGVDVQWVFLNGHKELLKSRMTGRDDHFFSAHLLDSQLEAFENPEYGIHVSIDQKPPEILDEIINKLNSK